MPRFAAGAAITNGSVDYLDGLGSPPRGSQVSGVLGLGINEGEMKRIPASGSAGLAASGLIQAALGVEFFLSGLNKFADSNFVQNFTAFVDSSPGTRSGLLAPLIHSLIEPNIAFFAQLTRYTELLLGIVLLLGAIEVGRRRLSGRLGRQHRYEPAVALIAALAGVATAGLSLSIALLMGEQLPTIMPGRALTTAIPVELLLVPLGLAVAWMEAGRFKVLKATPLGGAGTVVPTNPSASCEGGGRAALALETSVALSPRPRQHRQFAQKTEQITQPRG
jgi:hypothetical protein